MAERKNKPSALRQTVQGIGQQSARMLHRQWMCLRCLLTQTIHYHGPIHAKSTNNPPRP